MTWGMWDSFPVGMLGVVVFHSWTPTKKFNTI